MQTAPKFRIQTKQIHWSCDAHCVKIGSAWKKVWMQEPITALSLPVVNYGHSPCEMFSVLTFRVNWRGKTFFLGFPTSENNICFFIVKSESDGSKKKIRRTSDVEKNVWYRSELDSRCTFQGISSWRPYMLQATWNKVSLETRSVFFTVEILFCIKHRNFCINHKILEVLQSWMKYMWITYFSACLLSPSSVLWLWLNSVELRVLREANIA